jgi:hypothetical protein
VRTSFSTAIRIIVIGLSLVAFWWVVSSTADQGAASGANTERDRTSSRGYIADADEVVPSKEELLLRRLNPEGEPTKENLLAKTLAAQSEPAMVPMEAQERLREFNELKEMMKPFVEEEWQLLQEIPRPQRKPVPIVQPVKRRTPEEFLQYVHNEIAPVLKSPGAWKPSFITLHNTEKPALGDRPNGFTKDQIDNLAYYYGVECGWKAGPAAFVDDLGIWVFNGFTVPGRHSPCWNWLSWGIEQLGNFDNDEYDTGRGARVRDNAIAAIAILSVSQGLSAETLRFHKEDKCTSHKNCPGQKCTKQEVQAALAKAMVQWKKRWDELPGMTNSTSVVR